MNYLSSRSDDGFRSRRTDFESELSGDTSESRAIYTVMLRYRSLLIGEVVRRKEEEYDDEILIEEEEEEYSHGRP